MNRIRELREDNDILQKDAAKILSISQQQYSRYESELSEMTYEQLTTLAHYYNTSISSLSIGIPLLLQNNAMMDS